MKNIILCCDGTNNQFSGHQTNVIRLYKIAVEDPGTQVGFYDPGVGTMAEPGVITRIGKAISMVAGLAFGVGFLRNIADAYQHLMLVYEPGDRVFIFGFSRGAYTARALAGMLHALGLLYHGSENLIPYAIRYWQLSKDDAGRALCADFKATLARECKPHFVGVWDTVGSIGMFDFFRAYPYTKHNPDVAHVRHAVSIDERRATFRQNLMEPEPADSGQDIKNVWFAGVHSDVGGGYPPDDSGLSMTAFQWLVREAIAFGLIIDEPEYARQLAASPPNPGGTLHKSLTSVWWLLEFLPRRSWSYTENRHVWRFQPNNPRTIAPRSTLHSSVLERLRLNIGYAPPNLCSSDPVVVEREYEVER